RRRITRAQAIIVSSQRGVRGLPGSLCTAHCKPPPRTLKTGGSSTGPAPPSPAPPLPVPPLPESASQTPTSELSAVHFSPLGQVLPASLRQPSTHRRASQTIPLRTPPHSESATQSLSSLPSSGSPSPSSILPLWWLSSTPSRSPPSSESVSRGLVTVSPPSASSMQLSFDRSMSTSEQLLPTSVPSKIPSSSESSSRRLILPSPSWSS